MEREIRLRRTDGEYFWFLHRIVPFRDESGNVVKWIATLTDIHALKRSEESLRDERKQIEIARHQTEEQYRNVVETATDTVVSVDERSEILFANPATTRTFGYAPSELVGQPLTILMPEFMRKLHTAGLEGYVKTGHRHLNWRGTELVALRKNGEEFPVEVSFGEALEDRQSETIELLSVPSGDFQSLGRNFCGGQLYHPLNSCGAQLIRSSSDSSSAHWFNNNR